MAKQSLQTRIKTFLTSDRNQRDKLQVLIAECLQHGVQHKDWTVLSNLINGLRDNKSRNIKAITAYIADFTENLLWQKTKTYEGYKAIKGKDVQVKELTITWFEHKANQASQQVALDPFTRAKGLFTSLTKALEDGKIKEGEEEHTVQLIEALRPFVKTA